MTYSVRGILTAIACILLYAYGCSNADPVEIIALCDCDDDCLSTHYCTLEGICVLRSTLVIGSDGDIDDASVDSPDTELGTDGDVDLDSDPYQADYSIEVGDEIEWNDDCPKLPDDYIADPRPCSQIVCEYIGAPRCWFCGNEPDYSQENKPCPLEFGMWGRCINGSCDLADYPTCETAADCEELRWHRLCDGHWECVDNLCTQVCDEE